MARYILIAIVVGITLCLLLQAAPGRAQQPQPQEAPKIPVSTAPLPPGTGFRASPADLSHLTGQTMPDAD